MRVDKQVDEHTIIDDRFRLLQSINSIVIDDRFWVIALFVIDMVQGWGKYEIGRFEEDVAGELKCLITDCAFKSNLKFSALRGSSQYPNSNQDTQRRFRLGAEIRSPSRCLSRRLMVDLVGDEVCDIWTMLPIGLVSRPALALNLPNSSSPVLARPSWARRYRDGRLPHPRCIISTSCRVIHFWCRVFQLHQKRTSSASATSKTNLFGCSFFAMSDKTPPKLITMDSS